MAKTKINDIVDLLKTKSCAKQQAYVATTETFNEIKKVLKGYESNLKGEMSVMKERIDISFTETGGFEAQMRFAGDTIVVMMHTNIFDFDSSHFIHKTRYVKEDSTREYCGLIQVYNFLSDSLKYQRMQDSGVLIARIFVNKEKHFYIDGRRPLGLMYTNFEELQINEMHINNIVEEAILFCLNFDLQVPPFDLVGTITVEQQSFATYSSGFNTAKRMVGFDITNQRNEEPGK